MSDQAKVRIGGDAGGAMRATDQTRKGLKGVGDEAQKAGDQAKKAAENAAVAEKKYEAEVQRAIQRLKNKETQVKATEEAMKRMGKAESASQGGGMRAMMASRPPTVGGVTAGGVGQGLSRIGGQAGATFGALGSSLGNAVPAVAALGVAAAGLKVGFDALRASSELAAKVAGETVRLEQQRNAIIEAGTKALAQSTAAAAAEGGGNLREAIARGGTLSGVQSLADSTGLNTGQASAVAAQMSGLDEQSKKVIAQAVADAVRMGVDPVKTAEALKANSKGGLGDMDREAALRNAGNLFDNFSGQQIQQSLHWSSGDLNRLQDQSTFAGRESRAGLGNLSKDDAINAVNSTTADSARRASDPIGAALADHAKALKQEIEVLEAMGRAEHPLIRGLNDLTAAMKGGSGSYSGQANLLRKIAAAVGAN